MTEGLRLLPRVASKRDADFEEGDPYARHYANCTLCLRDFSRHERRCFGCGFLDRSEWLCDGEGPLGSKLVEEPVSVCAGYTTSLPEVLEANRALTWRKDGALSEYLDGERPKPMLKDAMDLLASAVSEAMSEVRREAKKEAARRGSR